MDGNYTEEFGGVQAQGKRTFGIFMTFDSDEEEAFEEQVIYNTYTFIYQTDFNSLI